MLWSGNRKAPLAVSSTSAGSGWELVGSRRTHREGRAAYTRHARLSKYSLLDGLRYCFSDV